MSKTFGTSEGLLFDSLGGRVKILEETEEVCQACEESANGPCNFGIIAETQASVLLICPNCGEEKTVRPMNVLRKKT